jgi:ribosomal protein S18 acetylase RimI-like enzyme
MCRWATVYLKGSYFEQLLQGERGTGNCVLFLRICQLCEREVECLMQILHAKPTEVDECIEAFMDSDVALRNSYTPKRIRAQLEDATSKRELYIARSPDGQFMGYVWISLTGAFYSYPYLRGIAVIARLRSRGVGRRLIEFFEQQAFAGSSRAFLLVGDYNQRAQQLYRSLRYEEVGRLADLGTHGVTEIIMMKRRPSSVSLCLEPNTVAPSGPQKA